jgi:hypothetical protein
MSKEKYHLAIFVLMISMLTACVAGQTAQPTSTPQPTDTLIPTPTLTVLYYSDAEAPDARWDLSESSSSRRYIDNGMYNLEIRKANYNAWGGHEKLETNGDFILDFDVSLVSGDGYAGGVLFCYGDRDNWYRVAIHGDGIFLLDGVKDGEGFEFVPRTFTEAVYRGAATNHIRLEYREPQIIVYVNNILTAMVMDTRFNSGHIAPFAWGEKAGTVVGFDNLLLTEAGPVAIPTLQASIYQYLPPPAGTPESFPFALTVEKYHETDNLEFACGLEQGSGWRMADWQDILDYAEGGGGIEALSSALGLQEDTSYFVSLDGQRWYSGERHYLIELHKHNLPDGWLSHADIDDHYLDLGSWYGLESQVLCTRGEASTVVQGTATPEKLATPDSPPEFIAGYVGTQQCAEWPYYAVFKVENTTLWVLQSEYLEIYDVTHDKVIFKGGSNEPFLKDGECPPRATILAPYNTRYVAANLQTPEPGTQFAAAIQLCTEDDLEGECALQIVEFNFEGE